MVVRVWPRPGPGLPRACPRPDPRRLYNLLVSILKVARMGHPVLRERARPVEKSDLKNPLVQKLIDDMVETMHEYHGVGLAGPQVHEGRRIFVALLDDEPGADSEAVAIINPEIVPNAPT